MKVAIIGAGYVGLVTGAGLASRGHDISLVDIDAQKVAMINQSRAPFHEVGLEPLLQKSVGKNLRATADTNEAVTTADVVFICVQTYCQDDGAIDLTHIKQAVTDVGKTIKNRKGHPLVVIKSTVIPRTTEKVLLPLLEKNSGKKAREGFGITVNPEFLREGRAVEDFLNPDRIVIGELENDSGDVLCRLYQDFNAPVLRVDLKTAEMIKYASNVFLATKISFINEIGNICKKLGIDTYRIAHGISLDSRISPHFLNAGIGFGGSCLPKDTKALIRTAQELGYQPSLLQSVIKVNEEQPPRLVELAANGVGELSQRKIAVLGLAFKPGTDDMRDSPAIKVVNELLQRGALVTAYDPAAMDNARGIFGEQIDYATSAQDAVSDAELVFIVTEWTEFNNPALYRGKKVFCGRRVFSPGQISNSDCEGVCW